MQARSWMAALTLGAGVVVVNLATPPRAVAADAPVVNKVTLELRITGLGRDGCEVEVKPAHPASQFKPVTRKVKATGDVVFPDIEVSSTSADRDCYFAIVVREPGQAPKTIRRGYRLDPPTATRPVPTQFIQCVIRSPSVIAREEAARTVK